MEYLIFTDIKEAESHQGKVDVELHYPESLDSLRWVGGGIHAPKELGRAMNFAQISKADKEEKFALPIVNGAEKITKPVTATQVSALPVGWYPAEVGK